MRPKDAPAALVLGGVSPHIAVIERLKQLGYYVVLADYKDAPPAAAHADEHRQISTLDAQAVEQAARELDARAVISVCLDQTLPIVAGVRAALGLVSPLSPQAAHCLTDKDAMKQVLRRVGVDTAKWVVAPCRETLDLEDLRFPVVAKPVGGTGSLGVVFARDRDELETMLDTSFAHAQRGPGEGAVLVEEFIDGLELSIDCIVIGGETHVLLARERHKTWFSGGTETTCHATLAPAALGPETETRMRAQARAIAAGFGVRDGPLLIQSILTADGRLVVLEVAGRIGGGPGANRVVELVTGFDYVGASIDQQLGRPVTLRLAPDPRIFSANNAYGRGGNFDRLVGMEALLEEGLVEEHYVYRMPGEPLADHLSARSRVAAFVCAADSREALKARLAEVFARLDVRDPEDRSLLCRDIGLHRSLGRSSPQG